MDWKVPMAQRSHQLYWEVTRPPCPLRQGRMSTTRCIYLWETFITVHVVRIRTLSVCWLFCRSQKVRLFCLKFTTIIANHTHFIQADREHANDEKFRTFRRQLLHTSIAAIFQPMKPHFSKPTVTKCADGHFRRIVYGFGPYIADYPEQVQLACVLQDWCPRCVVPRNL